MGIESRDDTFRAFFEAEVVDLQRFATFMCGDPDVAADLTQEALTRAYKRWVWVRHTEAPSYVRRIIVNLVKDRYRREVLQRTKRIDPKPDADWGRTKEVESWMLVTSALKALSPARRAVVILRFYDDLSEHQISAVLNRPLGTVKSDLHRYMRDLFDI